MEPAANRERVLSYVTNFIRSLFRNRNGAATRTDCTERLGDAWSTVVRIDECMPIKIASARQGNDTQRLVANAARIIFAESSIKVSCFEERTNTCFEGCNATIEYILRNIRQRKGGSKGKSGTPRGRIMARSLERLRAKSWINLRPLIYPQMTCSVRFAQT